MESKSSWLNCFEHMKTFNWVSWRNLLSTFPFDFQFPFNVSTSKRVSISQYAKQSPKLLDHKKLKIVIKSSVRLHCYTFHDSENFLIAKNEELNWVAFVILSRWRRYKILDKLFFPRASYSPPHEHMRWNKSFDLVPLLFITLIIYRHFVSFSSFNEHSREFCCR